MPVLADYHVIDFRQIHWLRGKITLTCCREQKATFFRSVALTLWFCCLYETSTIILVEVFSDLCCLEDNVSRKCRANTVARSFLIEIGVAIGAGCEKKLDMLKRWVMHLSPETPTPPPPTPGRREAYVGICKCLDDLPAPRGWGNSSL